MNPRKIFFLAVFCVLSLGLCSCDLHQKISSTWTGADAPVIPDTYSPSTSDYGVSRDIYGAPDIEYVGASDYSKSRYSTIAPKNPVVAQKPKPTESESIGAKIVDVKPIEKKSEKLEIVTVAPPQQLAPPPTIKPVQQPPEEPEDILLVPARVAVKSEPKQVNAAPKISGDEIIVARGDTIYGISKRAGVPLRDLADANNLSAPYNLSVGRKLKLPVARVHIIAAGETLYSVSRRYSVDLHSIVQLNELKQPYSLSVGQKLKLPASVRVSDLKIAAPVKIESPNSKVEIIKAPVGTSSKSPVTSHQSPVTTTQIKKGSGSTGFVKSLPVAAARASSKFAWPLRGKIVSDFGAKKNGLYNDGINIGTASGKAVNAAENGVVAYAGNELKGMGNLVIIRHSGGYMSVYAHMDSILVKRGTKVRVGQKIGTVGSTGKVSSPQLHFEIRKGTKAYDPKKMLK